MASTKKNLLHFGKSNCGSTKYNPTNRPSATSFAVLTILSSLFTLVTAQCLFAQTGRANITGTVTDITGAVISGANVTVLNNATGVVTTAIANDAGIYNVIQIIPGTYTVTVKKQGFTTQVQNDFTLVAEQAASLNFSLKPGAESVNVTVYAEGQLLNTENAELSQTINQDSIVELPLNGRNAANLVLLAPGTANVLNLPGAGEHQANLTFPVESGASANGGRQGSVLYLLDGSENMDTYHLLAAPFPNPDALEEFTVISNNFDARYGFAAGGVVSIVTKSGTNKWHGDVFEFLRNGDLNADDYFTKTSNNLKQNQFGGSVGGPIVKDKLFVFGNYQGTLASSAVNASNNYSPTAAMRNGDFSAFCQSGFNSSGLCMDTKTSGGVTYVNDQIWQPTASGHSGTTVTVAQAMANPSLYYPNNYINPATFAPASVKLVSLFPQPTDETLGHIQAIGYGLVTDYEEGTVRADYDLNNHNRISGRMFLDYYNQPPYSNNILSAHSSWNVDWQSYAGTWTDAISPHIVNNVTGAYSRMFDVSNSGLKVNGQQICFSQFIQVSEPTTTPCSIIGWAIGANYESGGTTISVGNFNSEDRWTGVGSESLSVSQGKHLIVSGVDVLRQWAYEHTDYPSRPVIGFQGGPQGQFTGSGWADLLLGDESRIFQGGGELNQMNQWMIAPYITDQFKVRPNLTLSFGLRWEPWIAPVLSGGRISMYIPGEQSTRWPNAPLGMVFPGDKGVPSAGMPSNLGRNFDPRIGFAWQPKFLPKTSIRSAVGVYATPLDYSSFNHSGDTPPFGTEYNVVTGTIVNGTAIPIIPFENPWSIYAPTGYTSPFPPFASPNSTPGPNAQFFPPITIPNAFAPDYKDGQTYTWNFTVEHQFRSVWLTRAAYVGVSGSHQSVPVDVNYGQFFGAGNPANGTVLNPNFGSVLVVESGATSSYNGAQFTLQRQMTHGLQFQASYTYSHTIDVASFASTAFTGSVNNPRCVSCNRGNSFMDVPQIFIANFLYRSPALQGLNYAAREILGAWEISGISTMQTGSPFTITSGQTTAWDAVGNDYPNYAPGFTSVQTHPHNLTNYISASNFVAAPQGSKGDVGRNPEGAFGPGLNNWDLAFSKNFPIAENYHFQFRWEMYNAFNRPTFANPTATWTSGQFGLINSTSSAELAREMQVAAKLYF